LDAAAKEPTDVFMVLVLCVLFWMRQQQQQLCWFDQGWLSQLAYSQVCRWERQVLIDCYVCCFAAAVWMRLHTQHPGKLES
jgi:hypothetical protein